MTPEELAKNELEKLRKSGELTFPIDPFKILHDAGIYVVLKDFENLEDKPNFATLKRKLLLFHASFSRFGRKFFGRRFGTSGPGRGGDDGHEPLPADRPKLHPV